MPTTGEQRPDPRAGRDGPPRTPRQIFAYLPDEDPDETDSPEDRYGPESVTREPDPEPEPEPVTPEPEPEPVTPEPVTLDILVRNYAPASILPGRDSGMNAAEIACQVAVAALKLLDAASDDPTGGFDFGSKDIWRASPELLQAFSVPNVAGTYAGRGLVVGEETIEPGLQLRRLNGHSPYRFAPSLENAQSALHKLVSHGWTYARIAAAVGVQGGPHDLAARLSRLWGYDRYRRTYRRGRRPSGRKAR